MRYVLYSIGGVAAFVAVIALGLGTSWFGLVAHRPMAKYAMETSRQVYMNSGAHEQGADAGIGISCMNMRNVSNATADRHAYAGMIVTQAASYGGTAELSPDSLACVAEARNLLSTPIQP